MNKLKIAIAALLVSAASVHAGEFDGFYIGGEGGFTSSREQIENNKRDKDWDGSVFAGFSTRVKKDVYLGGEVDFTYGGFEHIVDGSKMKNEYSGGITAKAGYVFTPEIAVYGLAGYDIANVKLEDKNRVANGFKFGAGVESYILDNITVRSELSQTRWRADDIKVKDIRTTVGLSYRF